MKIIPVEGVHIELAKRQGAPVRLEDACPKCGKVDVIDLSGADYLSNPVTGKPEDAFFYCQAEECETEWRRRVVVEITVRAARDDE